MTRYQGMLATAALATVVAALLAPWALPLEEALGLDLLFRLRGTRAPPGVVAVVAIDREAARALGQPMQVAEWPRELHARLVDALAAAGATAIAFDVSFATPARSPTEDEAFAAALRRAGNVVLLDFVEQPGEPGGIHHVERRLPPIEPLRAAAAAHGPFPLPKNMRVRAWWAYKSGVGGAPTLPVLVAELHARSAPAGTRAARRPDARDEIRHLDFYGPPRSLPTHGLHQVLAAAAESGAAAARLRAAVAGRAVFVGFSAAHPSEQDRVRDDYDTVFTRADGLSLNGVEIAATAFANLAEGRELRLPPLPLQLLLYALWGLLLAALATRPSVRVAVPAVLLAAGGYVAAASAAFASAVWLPLALPVGVQAPLALFGGALANFVVERRRRRQLDDLVDDLLPSVVVRNLPGRQGADEAGGRRMFGVFVLTDIEGFTTISESLAPEAASRLLNDYFGLIFPPVERLGGSVSEIHGDAMLAFWFAAERDASACRAACLAAIEIAALTRGRAAQAGAVALPTRIAVHAGEVTLARVGASRHHEYRIVGDTANTASRIEGLSKHLGTRLLVSTEVADALDGLLLRPLGAFVLAGKRAPVAILELMGLAAEATAERQRLCADFARMLEAWRAQDWTLARTWLQAILEQHPGDGPSRFYLDQVDRQCRQPPAADWDGSIHMDRK